MPPTPGPWTIWKEVNIVAKGGRRGVATTGGRSDENIANARLIAAAPDLMEALKTLVSQRDAHFHTMQAWDAARAAIAKAEGVP